MYRCDIPEEIAEIVKEFSELPILELKKFYEKQRNSEQEIAGKILTYIDEGADINTRNVEDVIEAIKRKMEERVDEGISDT